MIQVARGRLGNQIASDMGITETTVKVPSRQCDAEDECSVARRVRPNGGQA
jgi:FixJ family two-component response regulator